MESYDLIEYKWEQGVYNLKDMIKLVDNKEITKKQFFQITRYNYDGVLETRFLKFDK